MVKAVNGIHEVNLIRMAENLTNGDRGLKINSRVYTLHKNEGFKNFYQTKSKNNALVLIAEKIDQGKRFLKSFMFKKDGSSIEKTYNEEIYDILNISKRDIDIVHRNSKGNIISKKHLQKNLELNKKRNGSELFNMCLSETDSQGSTQTFGLTKKIFKKEHADGTVEDRKINENDFNELHVSLGKYFHRKA